MYHRFFETPIVRKKTRKMQTKGGIVRRGRDRCKQRVEY
jgi:hypothetical protein